MEQDAACIEAVLNPDKLLLPEPHRVPGLSAASHGLAQLCAVQGGAASAAGTYPGRPPSHGLAQAPRPLEGPGAGGHHGMDHGSLAPSRVVSPDGLASGALHLHDATAAGASICDLDAPERPLRARGAGAGAGLAPRSGAAAARDSEPASSALGAGSIVFGDDAGAVAGAATSMQPGNLQTHQGRAQRRRQVTDARLPNNMCAGSTLLRRKCSA